MDLLNQILEKEDLKRLIYSFGTVEHRIFMREFCNTRGYHDELIRRNDLVSPIPKRYQEIYHPNEMVIVYLTRFYQLRRCFCCSRHSHRKPNIVLLEDGLKYVENDEQVPEDTNHFDCRCACRHLMRKLARQLNWMI